MGQTAVVFPGQGAQQVGMGKDVAETYPRARAVFDKAGDVLGFDIAALCFEGPAEELEKTDIQQPAIFVASVAVWEAFLEAGGGADWFSSSGGLSLGEYTALHVAGSVNFDEALRLVRRRGQLMQEAALASPSGMVSLIGADEESANRLCDRCREGEVLAPANFNCPGQVVLSGSRAACERVAAAAEEARIRAVPLAVAGAFHSPFMEPAGLGLDPVLKETDFAPPRMRVVTNVDASYHPGGLETRGFLKQQVTSPVLWQRCVERLMADGVDRFVEMGPGRVLTGLMRKINRKVETLCLNSADSVAAAVEKLRG